MKIKVKSMKGGALEFDVTEDMSVLTLKELIQEKKEADPEAQTLIFKGKKLDSAKVIGDYKLKDGDSCVLMIKKNFKKAPKPAPAPAQPTTTTTAPTTNTTTAPTQPAQPTQPTQPAQPAPANNNTGAQAGNVGNGNAMTVGPEMEETVNQLMGMGFEREQVIAALQAAFFNPDRAVDYLLNGIPEGIAQAHAQAQA